MASMSSNCQFWMSNNAGTDTLQLPVLPEKITYKHNSKNDTVNVSGLGEITILQDPSALVLSFESHFPARAHQGSIPNPLEPQRYIDKIEEWRSSKKPIKFIVTGTQINAYFSVENFTYYEEGGDPDTLYYSIELKAYREVSVRKLEAAPTISIGMATSGLDSLGAGGVMSGKVKTKGGRLKLYKKASKSSKVVAKMPNKSKLTILSVTGSWYQVTYVKKNKTGFCKASKVKIT